MTITIDKAKAIELLEKAIKQENPGYTYVFPRNEDEEEPDGCVYAWGDQPSCIVGYAVNALDHEALMHLAHEEADHGSFSPQDTIHFQLPGYEVTEGARQVWAAAQLVQDAGKPWGTALGAARSKAELLADVL